MKELVTIQNGQPVTTSKLVAEHFGKRHDNIMREIKAIMALQPGVARSLKIEETYFDVPMPAGGVRKQPMYILSRDAFTLLVMGFTGKEALQFKLDYIAAFNKMEAELNRRSVDAAEEIKKLRAEANHWRKTYNAYRQQVFRERQRELPVPPERQPNYGNMILALTQRLRKLEEWRGDITRAVTNH